MARPYAWIATVVATSLVLVSAFGPEARTADREFVLSTAPVSPTVPLQLGGCPSVRARESYEERDCFQAIRLDLLEHEIDLVQALRLLEDCASRREDLVNLERRALTLRADALRSRQLFGDTLSRQERELHLNLETVLGRAPVADAAGAVSRLREAGITPDGFGAGQEADVLKRYASDPGIRDDFRLVFGDLRADELEALTIQSAAGGHAVSIGNTVVIPDLPVAQATADGAVILREDEPQGPRAVPSEAYEARLLADLYSLENARQRYLSSGARLHQRNGSVRAWIASLRRFGKDEEVANFSARAARDRAILAAELANLERRLGADPLLVRMAGESVGLVTEIDRTCASIAGNRQRWMRRGAGLVAGLTGAAGVVVATGATGTLAGGVTIAAALEAGLGAYLIARSERIESAIPSSARETQALAQAAEERRFRRPESEVHLDEGDDGAGAGSFDEWLDVFGDPRESDILDGDGIDDEPGDEETESAPRQNRIPPILPIDMPDELRELPPLLESAKLTALREMSLPEIQERLDVFLAGSDPAVWRRRAEEEDVNLWSAEQLIEEARASLRLWERQRELSERFGEFFIQAELERIPQDRRSETLLRAMGRYLSDRDAFAGSRDVNDLRNRLAGRLVTHCRAGPAAGDLALSACSNETALSIVLVAALRDAGVDIPYGSQLGIQVFANRVETVLFSREHNRVYSLTRGSEMEGVVAEIYHPATFYYTYLVSHGVTPEIDVEQHLLIALPDRPMPPELEMEECEPEEKSSVVSRAASWVGSLFGVRKISEDKCNPSSGKASSDPGGNRDVTLSIPTPRNPLQRGGGGQAGGGQGGGGGGGGNPFAENAPGDPQGGGSSSSPGESGGQGDGGKGDAGASSGSGETEGSGGAGSGSSADGTDTGAAAGSAAPDSATAGGQNGSSPGDSAGAGDEGNPGGAAGSGEGGYGIGNVTLPAGPNLTSIGRETVRSAARYDRAGDQRVMPWRLREDEGMATGSTSSVLYADNSRALGRFGTDDLFITLAPAEVEAQRRMLEANDYPIYPAETTCESRNLPPRRVLRRTAAGDPGYRYVFCDQDESMVVFRDREDADSYAKLSAPDRPLYLARLASERIARFERSKELGRLQAFLEDPNVLEGYSRDEIYGTVKAAADLLVFQNALESTLVRSMNELGPSGIRSFYFDMHREVLQAPFFIRIAEAVFQLNQRLASDPLQSLAWANAQDDLVRRGFFDLYFTIGGIMEWPERWATLEARYGGGDTLPAATEPAEPSLDFLQILSDPTRVQVDWTEERSGNPSIRDRKVQEGVERTPEDAPDPTMSDRVDLQEKDEHKRGGTDGLGKVGEGDSLGPERGRKPLQMILIRITPETGEPDREQLPEDNQIRPGGTEGRERRQTEESASRQEPILWVKPHTFIEAILSNWDSRDLRPETAGRVPPLLRFNVRLREVFLRDLHPIDGVYDNRLRAAMELFTRSGWLQYAEVRDAMGGPLVGVRAVDTGRFSGAYSGNAPINDEDQIRIPNFFSSTGVVIPRDLFEPVRSHYARSVLGIFDLTANARVPAPVSLKAAPVFPGGSDETHRATVIRTLEVIGAQAREAN